MTQQDNEFPGKIDWKKVENIICEIITDWKLDCPCDNPKQATKEIIEALKKELEEQ